MIALVGTILSYDDRFTASEEMPHTAQQMKNETVESRQRQGIDIIAFSLSGPEVRAFFKSLKG